MTVVKKIISMAIISAGLFILQGCQTLNDVVAAKNKGTEGISVEYQISKDQAWDIAKNVLRWEGVDAIEERRDQGYLVTSTGMSIGTAGTVIGVWVENGSSDNLTKVTVITKRRIVTNIITSLTEGTFHKTYAKAVQIIKSGNKLPATAPI
jgi:hypothetical protein